MNFDDRHALLSNAATHLGVERIEWSIETSSRLGYFAALCKRITIAAGGGVSRGDAEVPQIS
jgi:hypothetical protein